VWDSIVARQRYLKSPPLLALTPNLNASFCDGFNAADCGVTMRVTAIFELAKYLYNQVIDAIIRW
jgi:hypothetical protein